MVFPFEYGVQGSPENERQILRRLIYNEALLFKWGWKRRLRDSQEQQERAPRFVGRYRSQTMGAIPEAFSAYEAKGGLEVGNLPRSKPRTTTMMAPDPYLSRRGGFPGRDATLSNRRRGGWA